MTLSSSFKIGDRQIGGDAPCFVIAEAGVAHFGDFDKALKLVDLAVEAGADAVKFQMFDVERMITAQSQEWRDRLAPRALAPERFREIQAYAKEQGILFICTAHEEDSFDFLESLDVPAHKIGSGEFQNWPYLRHIASTGKPVFFSTGMYGLNDVAEALDVMTATGNHDIAVLQCTTLYPTPPADVNLRVMDSYRERFGGVIGYSDHTAGYHIPLAAVARGAMVVEKHSTLDFNVPNAQDWKVSCGPHDLGLFISELREIERALGISEKVQSAAEADSVGWARKSLVVARPIAKGDVIVEDLLIAKRPGTGIAPSEIDAVIGKRASRVLDVDHALTWSDLT